MTKEICPICDYPLSESAYSEIVTDEYGAQVHESCLCIADEDRDKYLTRGARGNLIYVSATSDA